MKNESSQINNQTAKRTECRQNSTWIGEINTVRERDKCEGQVNTEGWANNYFGKTWQL